MVVHGCFEGCGGVIPCRFETCNGAQEHNPIRKSAIIVQKLHIKGELRLNLTHNGLEAS